MEIAQAPFPPIPSSQHEGRASSQQLGQAVRNPGSLGNAGAGEPGPIVSGDQTALAAPTGVAGAHAKVLSSGERQILGLLFEGPESGDFTIYGHRPARPVVLGNFVDVRG